MQRMTHVLKNTGKRTTGTAWPAFATTLVPSIRSMATLYRLASILVNGPKCPSATQSVCLSRTFKSTGNSQKAKNWVMWYLGTPNA